MLRFRLTGQTATVAHFGGMPLLTPWRWDGPTMHTTTIDRKRRACLSHHVQPGQKWDMEEVAEGELRLTLLVKKPAKGKGRRDTRRRIGSAPRIDHKEAGEGAPDEGGQAPSDQSPET